MNQGKEEVSNATDDGDASVLDYILFYFLKRSGKNN